MRKVLSIFARDLKIAVKDPMAILMILMPMILALLIVAVTPGISETTLHFAVSPAADAAYVDRLSAYAAVETLQSEAAVEERVLRRDEVFGVAPGENGLTLVTQGNESKTTVEMAKVLLAMAETGEAAPGTDFGFYSFRDETPPLKRAFSVTLLLMISVVTAMLISLGLVDEKADQTIRAASVTPMPQAAYVLSKSLIGVLSLLASSAASLLILNITDVNWGQILVMIVADSLISIIVAFVIGLASTDFIEAAGSVKMLMLPMIASVLVYELTDPAWHFTVMWSPFYCAYRGLTEIVQGTAGWGSTLLYAAVILLLSTCVFLLCMKRIRKLMR